MKFPFMVFLLIVFTAAANAQARDSLTAGIVPGKFHKLLARSNGNWTGRGTIRFFPDMEPISSGTTVMVNTMSANGLYQISEFRGYPEKGKPWTGLRITGYDSERNVFTRAMIGDGESAGGVSMEGPWDEASRSITMSFKKVNSTTGEVRNLKEVYKIIDENTEVLEIHAIDLKTNKEYKMLNVVWTRNIK